MEKSVIYFNGVKSVLLVFFFAMLSVLTLNAQSSSNDELLKKLLDKNILTQEEVDELTGETGSSRPSFSDNVKKVREAFNTPYLKFGGYGLLWYQYKDHSRNHHDMGVRAIFLSISGQLTDHFRYFILGEISDPTIHEFYAEWMPANAFKLRGGQFKVPFTLENPISLADLETVSNTRSLSGLAGMVGDPLQYSNSKWVNKAGRDIGIQASGSLFEYSNYHQLLHYAMGVFQGTGINVSENNSTKDFAGTIMLQPLEEFRVAAGLYAGKASVYNRDGEFLGDHGRNRWALSSDYKSDRLYARAEWIHGNDGGIKKEGLYGTALYYLVPQKLNVVGKIDYFNQNKDMNDEVMDYVAAVNYYFYDKCRFQLNYTYSDYFKKMERKHSFDHLVQVQMQIVF